MNRNTAEKLVIPATVVSVVVMAAGAIAMEKSSSKESKTEAEMAAILKRPAVHIGKILLAQQHIERPDPSIPDGVKVVTATGDILGIVSYNLEAYMQEEDGTPNPESTYKVIIKATRGPDEGSIEIENNNINGDEGNWTAHEHSITYENGTYPLDIQASAGIVSPEAALANARRIVVNSEYALADASNLPHLITPKQKSKIKFPPELLKYLRVRTRQ